MATNEFTRPFRRRGGGGFNPYDSPFRRTSLYVMGTQGVGRALREARMDMGATFSQIQQINLKNAEYADQILNNLAQFKDDAEVYHNEFLNNQVDEALTEVTDLMYKKKTKKSGKVKIKGYNFSDPKFQSALREKVRDIKRTITNSAILKDAGADGITRLNALKDVINDHAYYSDLILDLMKGDDYLTKEEDINAKIDEIINKAIDPTKYVAKYGVDWLKNNGGMQGVETFHDTVDEDGNVTASFKKKRTVPLGIYKLTEDGQVLLDENKEPVIDEDKLTGFINVLSEQEGTPAHVAEFLKDPENRDTVRNMLMMNIETTQIDPRTLEQQQINIERAETALESEKQELEDEKTSIANLEKSVTPLRINTNAEIYAGTTGKTKVLDLPSTRVEKQGEGPLQGFDVVGLATVEVDGQIRKALVVKTGTGTKIISSGEGKTFADYGLNSSEVITEGFIEGEYNSIRNGLMDVIDTKTELRPYENRLNELESPDYWSNENKDFG